ncbi:MAG: NADH:flavin oxidoreductase/NADH oxidase [Pontimonas sp.]|nr:NADH:flavin oxidoreductase/NADH oxidase [Pontimonas sp.]
MVRFFEGVSVRGLDVPSRLWVSPMCQYSAVEGVVQYWHQVHYGTWAINKAGLIIAEATAVVPEGRITPTDSGLWNDEQASAWKPIVEFSHAQGVPMAIQLAHAGRKASTRAPFIPGSVVVEPGEGGWTPEAPSAEAYDGLLEPAEMSLSRIAEIVVAFAESAKRAVSAGFDAIEIHAAHGYLLHEFLSPLSNHRTDHYGGSLENRMRFTLEVVESVRRVIPESMPLFVRISATDWFEDGWSLEESIALSQAMEALGVDLIDVSSGGLAKSQPIKLGPGYQMGFAKAISQAVGCVVGTVGLITEAQQAEDALQDGVGDVVLMGRQFLREPSYALRAARELGADVHWPGQYERAKL